MSDSEERTVNEEPSKKKRKSSVRLQVDRQLTSKQKDQLIADYRVKISSLEAEIAGLHQINQKQEKWIHDQKEKLEQLQQKYEGTLKEQLTRNQTINDHAFLNIAKTNEQLLRNQRETLQAFYLKTRTKTLHLMPPPPVSENLQHVRNQYQQQVFQFLNAQLLENHNQINFEKGDLLLAEIESCLKNNQESRDQLPDETQERIEVERMLECLQLTRDTLATGLKRMRSAPETERMRSAPETKESKPKEKPVSAPGTEIAVLSSCPVTIPNPVTSPNPVTNPIPVTNPSRVTNPNSVTKRIVRLNRSQ